MANRRVSYYVDADVPEWEQQHHFARSQNWDEGNIIEGEDMKALFWAAREKESNPVYYTDFLEYFRGKYGRRIWERISQVGWSYPDFLESGFVLYEAIIEAIEYGVGYGCSSLEELLGGTVERLALYKSLPEEISEEDCEWIAQTSHHEVFRGESPISA